MATNDSLYCQNDKYINSTSTYYKVRVYYPRCLRHDDLGSSAESDVVTTPVEEDI